MDEVLAELGYSLEDDSWGTEDGRRTYSHESDATAPYLRSMMLLMRPHGFEIHPTRIRSLYNLATGEIIELEPGGFDCAGHLLHHMKTESVT